MKDSIDHFRFDAREDAQTCNVGCVEVLEDVELGNGGGPENQMPVDVDAETVDLGQGLAVGAGKGVEGGGRDLCGAVATVQRVAEEKAHLGDDKGSGNDERAEQVVDGIGLESKDWGLRAGKDDGLAQVGQHEGEGRGRVSQRIGAVEDDEAVKKVVVFLDGSGHVGPVVGRDVAGVEQRVKFQDGVADVSLVGCWGCSQTVELNHLTAARSLQLDFR